MRQSTVKIRHELTPESCAPKPREAHFSLRLEMASATVKNRTAYALNSPWQSQCIQKLNTGRRTMLCACAYRYADFVGPLDPIALPVRSKFPQTCLVPIKAHQSDLRITMYINSR